MTPRTRKSRLEKRKSGRRVVYRVEKFSETVRGLVDRGLAQGKSYRQIQEEVVEAGEQISENALGRYWRHRWQEEHRELSWVNAQAEALARVLRHTGESDEAVAVRKLLLATVIARMEKALKKVGFADLLRETREIVKATKDLTKPAPARQPMSAAERRRRLREIYGWPQEEIEAYEKQKTSSA